MRSTHQWYRVHASSSYSFQASPAAAVVCLGTAQHCDAVGQLVAVGRQVFSQLMVQHVTCTGSGPPWRRSSATIPRGQKRCQQAQGHLWAHMLGLGTYWSLPEAKIGYRASHKVALSHLAGPRSPGTALRAHHLSSTLGTGFKATATRSSSWNKGRCGCPGPAGAQAMVRRPSCLPHRWSCSGCRGLPLLGCHHNSA